MIMQIGSMDKSKLAKTDDEFLRLVESEVDWIARSADDVRQLREAEFGPFAKLPEDDFRAFLESLEFNRGGVSTGSYRPLMGSLSLTELFEVFECFGMSQELVLEGRDRECTQVGEPPAGECRPKRGAFCTVFCLS
jgi:hypothetical protein